MHGACPTDFIVNTDEDSATDVTLNRDLSKCSMFYARRQSTSPMALITGMVRDSFTLAYKNQHLTSLKKWYKIPLI